MKIILQRLVLSAIVLSATAWSSFGEQFKCKNAAGCPASITSGGSTRTVVFRKGDLIDTDSGWIVDPELGWKKVSHNLNLE